VILSYFRLVSNSEASAWQAVLMSRTLSFALLVVGGVVGIIAFMSWQDGEISDLRHLGTPRNSVVENGRGVTIPLPEGPAQRRKPIVVATTTGSHEFLFGDVGESPVRYDPCRPVAWMVSPAGMPPGAVPLLEAAADRVAAATGMDLVYAGTTSEPAGFARELIQERYGDVFAPVVVGWSSDRQNPDLAGAVTGVGGSSAVNGAYGEQRYLHAGVIILDSTDIAQLMAAPQGQSLTQAIVMHEWGHVLGLAHVADPNELMNASNSSLTSWGPGDLEGLAVAGSGPCEDV